MRAYFVFLTGDWRPNAINTNPVIAIGSWFDCRLVVGMNEVIFAGNKYTALLHDVSGKTANISSSEHSVQFWIHKYRSTRFAGFHCTRCPRSDKLNAIAK